MIKHDAIMLKWFLYFKINAINNMLGVYTIIKLLVIPCKNVYNSITSFSFDIP